MCPTLQESDTESTECVGALGEATVLAESKPGAAYSTKVWTSWDHAGFESSQYSTVGTKIPGTTSPSTTTSTNAIVGK
ncbi:hypothetical protein CR513_40364, partial [Mucuna pruriens]